MLKLMRSTLLVLFLFWSAGVLAGGPAPTIAFTPANPTPLDSIIATLSVPDCGGTTTVVVAALQINITTVYSGICGTPPPVTPTTLGLLPAGNYQVQWFIAPGQTPVATAILGVTAAAAPTPALGGGTMLIFALGLVALAGYSFRRRLRA